MKKLPINIESLKKLRPRKAEKVKPGRITNDTVAEHRERILAGGRKFKYPVQYARHKLVFNAIIIAAVAGILLVIFGWWQLYPMQNSSALMYRITRVLPVPVASVNGESVPYRDYLLQYRGSEYYLEKYGEIKLSSEDGKRQLDYIKRQSLDKAEQVAYARQLAKSDKISVTSKEVDDFIDQERTAANGTASQETYDAAIKMYLDQDADDYRLSVKNSLLKSKVAFAVDTQAAAQAKKASELVASTNGDFAKAAEEISSMPGAKAMAGQSGLVNSTSKYGGLRVSEVAKLSVGQVSGMLKSTAGDGYYFVRLINKVDAKVDFTYLHIPLSTFDANFAALQKAGKIKEYISVPTA